MTYLGVTYDTKEGTLEVDPVRLKVLREVLEMLDGKEAVTKDQLLKIKEAIDGVECYPREDRSKLEEVLDSLGERDEAVQLEEGVLEEMMSWRSWNGCHRIRYDLRNQGA